MKTNIAIGLAVVALIIAGIAYLGHSSKTLFGSTACSNITCLSGGLRLVTGSGGDFESDVAALFGSTVGVTATTTLSDTVNLNNPGICVNFFATSTETVSHLVASTTATIEGIDGVMMFAYGACAL